MCYSVSVFGTSEILSTVGYSNESLIRYFKTLSSNIILFFIRVTLGWLFLHYSSSLSITGCGFSAILF